eukprot:2500690-Amphidinium_carterae.1
MQRTCLVRTSCQGRVRQTFPAVLRPPQPASPTDVAGANNVSRRWRTGAARPSPQPKLGTGAACT